MGPDAMIFIFWMLSFKPTFSVSTFTFIKRLFSSSSLSAIRVVSSAYLRLSIFLLAIVFQLEKTIIEAHLMWSGQGDFSPLPVVPGWHFWGSVALAPGTQVLSPLYPVLRQHPLPLGQWASLLLPHFWGWVPQKEGFCLPRLHMPCSGALQPRPPCPAQAEHQPPHKNLFSQGPRVFLYLPGSQNEDDAEQSHSWLWQSCCKGEKTSFVRSNPEPLAWEHWFQDPRLPEN